MGENGMQYCHKLELRLSNVNLEFIGKWSVCVLCYLDVTYIIYCDVLANIDLLYH